MSAAPAVPQGRRWLFGPAVDLLLGCGLGYSAIFVVGAVAGFRFPSGAAFMIPLLTLLLSAPHYGATLVRVYGRAGESRRYWNVSVWATLLVAVAFVGGVYNTSLACGLATLYLTWSPWHYTGQNYGLSVLFLKRRGVEMTPGAKRSLHASFQLSYVLTFLILHQQRDAGSSVYLVPTKDVHFLPLGLPEELVSVLLVPVGLAYLACLIGAFAALARNARVIDLLPTAALAVTQMLWFSIPYTLRHWLPGGAFDPADVYYLLWISLGHAVQYLWVTSFHARSSGDWRGHTHYFARTLVAGAAIWALPAILFSPDVLGGPAFDIGLALLVASAVNVHHFILDGAIWKLRDPPVARLLFGDDDLTTRATTVLRRRGPMLRRLGWSVAVLGLVAQVYVIWAHEIVYPRAVAQGDFARASRQLDGIALVGRDVVWGRNQLAQNLLERKELLPAERELVRSLELRPRADGFHLLASLRVERQDWEGAVRALEEAIVLSPEDPELLGALSYVRARLRPPT